MSGVDENSQESCKSEKKTYALNRTLKDWLKKRCVQQMMQESHRGQRKTREIGSVETEVRQHLKEGRISSLLPWKPQKIACEAEGVIRTYEAFYLREVRSVFGNTAEK